MERWYLNISHAEKEFFLTVVTNNIKIKGNKLSKYCRLDGNREPQI